MQDPVFKIFDEPIARDFWLINVSASFGGEEFVGTYIFDASWQLVFSQFGRTVARLPDPQSHYTPLPLLS